MRVTAVLGVVALGVHACAGQIAPMTLQDSAYEEMVATRMSFSRVWPAVPTGWNELPCDTASAVALSPLDSSPLLLCGGKGVYNLAASAFVAVATPASVDILAPGWVFIANAPSLPAGAAPLFATNGTSLAALQCSSATTCTVQAFSLSATPAANAVVSVTSSLAYRATGASAVTVVISTSVNETTHLAGSADPTVTSTTAAWQWASGALSGPVFTAPQPTAALAYSSALNLLALGNSVNLTLLAASTFTLVDWQWVNENQQGWGAPIDDAITALAFDDEGGAAVWTGLGVGSDGTSGGAAAPLTLPPGTLYIGNPTALNVRLPPFGSYFRLAGVDGLPYGNITSLAVESSTATAVPGRTPGAARRVFVGTAAGLVLFDPSAAAEYGASASSTLGMRQSAAGSATVDLPLLQRWRWLAGARWLPVAPSNTVTTAVTSVLSLPTNAVLPYALTLPDGSRYAAAPPPTATTLVLTPAGVSMLSSTTLTLASKADFYTASLPFFNYSHLVGPVSLPSFGVTAGATPTHDDNSGLWTSLLITAFALKYNMTGNPADGVLADGYYQGMRLLNTVTGQPGYYARSLTPPGVAPPPAAAAAALAEGMPPVPSRRMSRSAARRQRRLARTGSPQLSRNWYPSPTLSGYFYESDTSSDEVTGHVMAEASLGRLMQGYAGGQLARLAVETLVNTTLYIQANDLCFVDSGTGNCTTWGKWGPELVVFTRSWSDQRGLNSLQALGLLSTALELGHVAGIPANVTAPLATELQRLVGAYGYDRNMLNTKLVVPDDDNYSDDELTFFSFYGLAASAYNATGLMPATLAALARTWSLVSFSRPSLWHAMSVGMLTAAGGNAAAQAAAASGLPLPSAAQVAADIAWQLRAWPLEPVDWPVDNSIRRDVYIDPEIDRDMDFNTQAWAILPPNERCMLRWNDDPRQLREGSGYGATDPGAFLLPYWVSRYYGLLASPAGTR